MSWISRFKERCVSAEEAVQLVNSGDHVPLVAWPTWLRPDAV